MAQDAEYVHHMDAVSMEAKRGLWVTWIYVVICYVGVNPLQNSKCSYLLSHPSRFYSSSSSISFINEIVRYII